MGAPPFRPFRHGIGMLPRLTGVGGADFVKQLLSPVICFGDLRLPKVVPPGNARHSNIPPKCARLGLFRF